MNKKYLYFIPFLILIIISAYTVVSLFYSLLGGLHAPNSILVDKNINYYFWIFISSAILNIVYCIYLLKYKKVSKKTFFIYLPVTFLMFIALLYFFMQRPYGKREVSINIGEDPFVSGTKISSFKVFNYWESGFYLPKFIVRSIYADDIRHQMQVDRRGSLIGHVGTDLQGWSDEKILRAFGKPAEIIKVNENMEKWIYHPWSDRPNWEMPVYVKNGELMKVGD